MAGMMVIALSVSVLIDKQIELGKRFLLGFISLIIVATLVPFALKYAGVSDFTNPSSILAYIKERQSYNMEGGGGVNISSMNLPMQLFTYMFRPVLFEANSITSFAAAVDNTILLFLFLIGSISLFKKHVRNTTENRNFLWFYALLAWLILALTSANLGISIRQKWMFAPLLIYLYISRFKKK